MANCLVFGVGVESPGMATNLGRLDARQGFPGRRLPKLGSAAPGRVVDPPQHQPRNDPGLRAGLRDGAADVVARLRGFVENVVSGYGYYVPYRDRDDVVQDVLVDLLAEVRRSPEREDTRFLLLARVIAHRRCVDWVRRSRWLDPLATPGHATSPSFEREILATERRRLGMRVVRRLKDPCLELFALHAGLGLKHTEIAERLGRSAGAVRTQMHECLKRARDLLRQFQARPAPTGAES